MSKECHYPEEITNIKDLTCWALGQVSRPFDSPELIRSLLVGIKNITGGVRADLLLYQSDMNILFFSETVAADQEGAGHKNISIADTKNSTPVEALAGGHTVLVADVRNSGLLALSSGSRTLLSIPVIHSENIHGVLNLEHAEPDAFDSETVRWVEALSGIFAALLEQSFLSEQVFRLNQRLIDHLTTDAVESDPAFRAHAERVSILAVAIAEKLELDNRTIHAVRDSGFLHDIGKSGVRQSILVKPGNLTAEEFDEVKRHPILGRFLLKPLGFQPAVIEGVASHHERWDGTGYPRGLSGNKIPITGRILAVAEAYDVMTSDQPYRKKLSMEETITDIRKNAGGQFDPDVVEALLRLDPDEL